MEAENTARKPKTRPSHRCFPAIALGADCEHDTMPEASP
jgi:hypothetical protein